MPSCEPAKMKLLVTGGCGFIGSAVVRQAIARGWQVVNLDALTYAANQENLASISGSTAYVFEHADIRDPERTSQILAEHKPDAIIHLAAESHVDRSIDGPLDFVDTNIVGTVQLLQASRDYLASLDANARSRFRFHHVSTDEVYGSLGATGQFTETSAYQPNSPYAASKASADMLVRAWRQTYDFPCLITNCSNNYGPFQFPEKLIPVVILSAMEGKPIPIYGDGSNVRDWLHVEDHADALLTILQHGRLGEVYNIGGNAERSNLDLVRLICSELDLLHPKSAPHAELITFVADRPGHDDRYAIDASKLEAELNWRPTRSLEDGIRDTVDWYTNNEAWCRDALVHAQGHARLDRQGLSS
jgi:dTDP-glucose 4,6-dehydratase